MLSEYRVAMDAPPVLKVAAVNDAVSSHACPPPCARDAIEPSTANPSSKGA
jgi:hypothetical protein